ncbi:MAG: glycosyltransferase family 2 protein [Chloroflexota bacterium]|nr:glycosyltransferase family 2 protein [Chloroflexota bacterium]
MPDSAPRISVIINTLNEEKNLPYALRSVAPWADEIVVVDMHSEDRTAEIAREYGAKVYLHERMGFADPARSFAFAQATGDWLLVLDADELIPAPLSQQLRAISREDDVDVVMIPRVEYMLGAPVRHAWGPQINKHPRFFRRGMVRLNAEIHHFVTPMPGARVVELPHVPGAEMVHFAYLDTASFLDKMNRYSTIEAQQSFARGKGEAPAWVIRDMALYPTLLAFYRKRGNTPVWALVYAFLAFINRYIKNRGYRDGWRGLYTSLFWGGYFLASYAKLTELEQVGSREEIIAHYGREAERILTGYETPVRDGTRPASLPPSGAR